MMETHNTKTFKNIDEQLAILKQRGLSIADEACAKRFLLNNNYYRISGYSLTLRDHDKFYPKTTIENVMDIYNFDQAFRHLLLYTLELIEVAVKSVYVYEFTKSYGSLGHLESANFTNLTQYQSIIHKATEQQRKRLTHEAFLKHFVEELQQDIPFWAFIDLFTIADISRLYGISTKDIKDSTANHFGFKSSNASNIMEKYLHGMTILRNLCAHGSRLYNRLFVTKPNLNRTEVNLLCKNKHGDPDNTRLFGYILNIKRLLSPEQFCDFKDRLLNLTHLYPFINMKYYGFCDNWKNIL